MSIIEELKSSRDSWRHQTKTLHNQLDRERQEWAEKLNSAIAQLDEIPRLQDQIESFERAESAANRRVAQLERERDGLRDICQDATRQLEEFEEKQREYIDLLSDTRDQAASWSSERDMWRQDASNLRSLLAKTWETLEFLRSADAQHIPGRCDAAMNAIWRVL